MEMTKEAIGQAFEELKLEVKAGRLESEKLDKINIVLDSWEEKSAKIVELETQETTHATEVKELKAALELKGEEAGQIRTRVDELEAAYARRSEIQSGHVGADEYKGLDTWQALNEYCRIGDDVNEEQKALLRTDSAVDGGVLTTTEMDSSITKKIVEIDPLRGICRVRTIASKNIELPIRSSIPVATYEGEAETGADSTSLYENVTVTPYRQTFTVPATKDQLMDAAFDMESEITSDSTEAFAFGEGQGFVTGTGHKMPEGITYNAVLQAAALDTTTASILSPEDLILIQGQVKTGYNLRFVLNRRTLATARVMRSDAITAADGKGLWMWQPGLDGPASNTLGGLPYILANSMPDIAASAYPIACGDFQRGYTIIDRTGMSIVRDEFTRKKEGIVEFTMQRWNTGMVTLPEAIKLLKILAP